MNSGMAISFASSMVSSCLPVSLSVRPKYRQYTTSCRSVTPLTSGCAASSDAFEAQPAHSTAASVPAHRHAPSFFHVLAFIRTPFV